MRLRISYPDHIVSKEIVYNNESYIIYIYIKDISGKLFFDFDEILLIKELRVILGDICKELSDKTKSEILIYLESKNINALFFEIYTMFGALVFNFLDERTKKIHLKSFNYNSDNSIFDCKSCISTNVVSKGSFDKDVLFFLKYLNGIFLFIKMIFLGKKYSLIAKAGKVVLNTKDIKDLNTIVCRWQKKNVNLARLLKIEGILLKNIQSNNLYNKNIVALVKLCANEKRKQELHLIIWDSIRKILLNEGVKFYPIKGLATFSLYENMGDRHYSDIDILLTDINDFFKVAFILKEELGFDYDNEIGTSLSLEERVCGEDLISYTGHCHLVKYVNGVQVNLDLAFPNLPILSEKIFNIDMSKNYYESLFMVSFVHVFKHDTIAVKDLNDLYLLVKKRNIDWAIIYRLAKDYSLEYELKLIIFTLNTEYNTGIAIDNKEEMFSLFEINKIRLYKIRKKSKEYNGTRYYIIPMISFWNQIKHNEILKIKDIKILNNKKSFIEFEFNKNVYVLTDSILGIKINNPIMKKSKIDKIMIDVDLLLKNYLVDIKLYQKRIVKYGKKYIFY